MSEKRPPGCENCEKKCTIHLTQIVGNQVVKVDLCEECPHAQKLQDPDQFELLNQILDMPRAAPEEDSGIRCPTCGMSERQFQKYNRFGCAQCYEVFGEFVEKLLPQLHKDTKHRGKIPKPFEKEALRARVRDLNRQMEDAVKAEDFETAARVRDELHRLDGGSNGDSEKPARN